MDFNQKLANYARLLVVHGLNVQPGQLVNIVAEAYHRDFALLVSEEAYKAGALHVNIDLVEPRLTRARILYSKPDNLGFQPKYISAKYDEFVENVAANLRLVGMEHPDMLADLDAKLVNTMRLGQYHAMRNYYKDGIEKSRVHWAVAAAATPRWAQRIFPALDGPAAEKALWEQILKICRADRPDCLELWKRHNLALQSRALKLTSLRIKRLIFSGPDTNLSVGISPIAIFKGGGEMGPSGVEFEPNIPTEECFTTPDSRTTEGHVRATRPFLVNGRLIKGLKLRFEGGRIVEFSADDGADVFDEYISSDQGGRSLGEVALVGTDSPVFQSGLVFEEILFDENAACHIAVGSSYKFCLQNGAQLSDEELANVGANQSTVHTDIMISNEQVDVTAETYDGAEVPIIRAGQWAKF